MPYLVFTLDAVYASEPDDDVASAQVVEDFLNTQEAEGYLLTAVIPDHRLWDEDGESTGLMGTKLVMHKPRAGSNVSLSIER